MEEGKEITLWCEVEYLRLWFGDGVVVNFTAVDYLCDCLFANDLGHNPTSASQQSNLESQNFGTFNLE